LEASSWRSDPARSGPSGRVELEAADGVKCDGGGVEGGGGRVECSGSGVEGGVGRVECIGGRVVGGVGWRGRRLRAGVGGNEPG
jgi:hypothetical protein